MQVEENNLCMVTKNAQLQQQNQHLQEKLETQRQQQLHQQRQLLISQQEVSYAALCMMPCGPAGYLALLVWVIFQTHFPGLQLTLLYLCRTCML